MLIDAFHLPALAHLPTTTWDYDANGTRVTLRIPQLTPALLRLQTDALLRAREIHLAGRPVEEIVAIIGTVAARFLDHGDQLRMKAEAALPRVTGSSAEMARLVLDRMAEDWRAEQLWELLRAEFHDPAVLDGFRPRGDGPGRTRALGPRLTTHIFSGNVPGVAVTSLIRSLLVKSAALGKTAVGEPVLAALFASGIAEADPGLGECIAVTYWPGGHEALEKVALDSADAVTVYGSRETVASIQGRCSPSTLFLGYGHRVSFGVVAREALAADEAPHVAALAASDTAIFDQQGCVSPHLFYVEEGGEISPAQWTRLLADELDKKERELPRGDLAPGEASAVRQLRGEMEFAHLSGQDAVVYASTEGTQWTAIYDPDPAFAASCLNRVVRVKPVASLAEVPALVRPVASVLQSVGIAGPEKRMTEMAEDLAALGITRITSIGSLPWPRPWWHHDGHAPLLSLTRWCDWE